MNAKEARQIAATKNLSDFQNNLDYAMEKIKRSSAEGNYSVRVISLREDVEEKLTELGYKVKYSKAEYNNTDLIITW